MPPKPTRKPNARRHSAHAHRQQQGQTTATHLPALYAFWKGVSAGALGGPFRPRNQNDGSLEIDDRAIWLVFCHAVSLRPPARRFFSAPPRVVPGPPGPVYVLNFERYGRKNELTYRNQQESGFSSRSFNRLLKCSRIPRTLQKSSGTPTTIQSWQNRRLNFYEPW